MQLSCVPILLNGRVSIWSYKLISSVIGVINMCQPLQQQQLFRHRLQTANAATNKDALADCGSLEFCESTQRRIDCLCLNSCRSDVCSCASCRHWSSGKHLDPAPLRVSNQVVFPIPPSARPPTDFPSHVLGSNHWRSSLISGRNYFDISSVGWDNECDASELI